MYRRPISAAAYVSFALLSGCGTLRNFADPLPVGHSGQDTAIIVRSGGRQIYGGARSDLIGLYCLENPLQHPIYFIAGAYSVVVDLPLSLIGDTMTLPWTINATNNRLAKLEESSGPAIDDRRILQSQAQSKSQSEKPD